MTGNNDVIYMHILTHQYITNYRYWGAGKSVTALNKACDPAAELDLGLNILGKMLMKIRKKKQKEKGIDKSLDNQNNLEQLIDKLSICDDNMCLACGSPIK